MLTVNLDVVIFNFNDLRILRCELNRVHLKGNRVFWTVVNSIQVFLLGIRIHLVLLAVCSCALKCVGVQGQVWHFSGGNVREVRERSDFIHPHAAPSGVSLPGKHIQHQYGKMWLKYIGTAK